jgi:hypothetical protein
MALATAQRSTTPMRYARLRFKDGNQEVRAKEVAAQ